MDKIHFPSTKTIFRRTSYFAIGLLIVNSYFTYIINIPSTNDKSINEQIQDETKRFVPPIII